MAEPTNDTPAAEPTPGDAAPEQPGSQEEQRRSKPFQLTLTAVTAMATIVTLAALLLVEPPRAYPAMQKQQLVLLGNPTWRESQVLVYVHGSPDLLQTEIKRHRNYRVPVFLEGGNEVTVTVTYDGEEEFKRTMTLPEQGSGLAEVIRLPETGPAGPLPEYWR